MFLMVPERAAAGSGDVEVLLAKAAAAQARVRVRGAEHLFELWERGDVQKRARVRVPTSRIFDSLVVRVQLVLKANPVPGSKRRCGEREVGANDFGLEPAQYFSARSTLTWRRVQKQRYIHT